MCELCSFVITKDQVFNDYLHNDSHIQIFVKNNLHSHCTFGRFSDSVHNFRHHIDSKKHDIKVKKILLRKIKYSWFLFFISLYDFITIYYARTLQISSLADVLPAGIATVDFEADFIVYC